MTQQYCYNCSEELQYNITYPVDDNLTKTWQISVATRAIFNRREGQICQECGISTRAQGLAKAILDSKYGYSATSLRQWVERANEHNLAVCELNSCHELHKTFKKLKCYTYAEYGTVTEQDIEHLTYADNTFDLLLHSETVEHVSRPRVALDECRRVIKQDGFVLFTTPVIWNRKSRQRAKHESGKITYLLEPSYHGQQTDDYLVCFEYGRDIDHLLGVTVCYIDWRNQNYVFVSGKSPAKISTIRKTQFRILEKVAEKEAE